MSKHTVELRHIIRNAEVMVHGSYTDFQYTDATWRALGLDSYPIYDESHRVELNTKICDHFYMREIGAETVPMFRLYLRRTMNEIMPYYNELYKSATYLTDPLGEIDMVYTEGWGESGTVNRTSDSSTDTDRSGTSNMDTKTSQTTDSQSSSMFSDTPMSMVQDDGGTLLEDGNYATNTTFDKSSTDVEGTSSTNGRTSDTSSEKTSSTDDTRSTNAGSRDRTEKGHRKSQAEMILEWRRAILNVDDMILSDSELNDCFMLVY